jgi:hypothetical protein
MRLHYKDQMVKVVCRTNDCLLRELYETQKYTLWKNLHSLMLNIMVSVVTTRLEILSESRNRDKMMFVRMQTEVMELSSHLQTVSFNSSTYLAWENFL